MWYHLSHARVLKLDKLVSMHIYIYIYMLKTFLALEKRTVFSGEMDIGQLYLGLNYEHQEKSSQQIS